MADTISTTSESYVTTHKWATHAPRLHAGVNTPQPVATDGMDGNGLKLEKIGHIFQVLMLRVTKIIKKFTIHVVIPL